MPDQPSAERAKQAILANAAWFATLQTEDGFLPIPADEYYGIPGDASVVGHSVSVRMYGWALSGNDQLSSSAIRSLDWLAERQDSAGGWSQHAGYALDAAQCVLEGLCTYERLAGDRRYHETLIRAADRMIGGTIDAAGRLKIANLAECGEYAHFAYLAWAQTGLERHRLGAERIVRALEENFNSQEGFWNSTVEFELSGPRALIRYVVRPVLRFGVRHIPLRGSTVARISQSVLPYVTCGRGPQYAIGLMDAEALLDDNGEEVQLPRLRQQTVEAVEWVKRNCSGPVTGSLTESRVVRRRDQVYPLPAINDSTNASLWPTAVYVIALVALGRAADQPRLEAAVDWIISMQDADGGFLPHQGPDLNRFGRKYGNVNFYASTALWLYLTRRGGGNLDLSASE